MLHDRMVFSQPVQPPHPPEPMRALSPPLPPAGTPSHRFSEEPDGPLPDSAQTAAQKNSVRRSAPILPAQPSSPRVHPAALQAAAQWKRHSRTSLRPPGPSARRALPSGLPAGRRLPKPENRAWLRRPQTCGRLRSLRLAFRRLRTPSSCLPAPRPPPSRWRAPRRPPAERIVLPRWPAWPARPRPRRAPSSAGWRRPDTRCARGTRRSARWKTRCRSCPDR